MSVAEAKRRLVWHGVLLVLLGLLTGVAIPLLENPRMGVSAHLAGVQNGILLGLVGLVWIDVKLSERLAAAAFWLLLFSLYALWLGNLLGAAFGTSGSNAAGRSRTRGRGLAGNDGHGAARGWFRGDPDRRRLGALRAAARRPLARSEDLFHARAHQVDLFQAQGQAGRIVEELHYLAAALDRPVRIGQPHRQLDLAVEVR